MIMGTKWTQVWTDTFSGPAGQGVSTANWKYDTGQGVFGTGEVERMTDSTANVHTDGQGNLDIVPLRGPTGWTAGRIQTTRAFAAPAGGEMMITASIVQPNPASGIGYSPRRDRGRGAAKSTSWRTSTAPARWRAPCTAAT
jgi:hypothetical protein